MKRPQFFGLHAEPSKKLNWFLCLIPFVLIITMYFTASHIRHIENPSDKLLPTAVEMVNAMGQLAFHEDRRTGDFLLLSDTISSLSRIFIGVGAATITALLLGLNMGLYKGLRSVFNPFITFFSMIPPLAILPILFISFGVGELGKIMLIFIGTAPILIRDVTLHVANIPKETIVKAQTLGANNLQITYKIIMPLVIPKLTDAIRLSLGSAWLFLIAAEAIASTDGLGYRIFLMRRYLNMDVILPYVLWITVLGVLIDFLLRTFVQKAYPWYSQTK
ncbi:ABC transporter permease [Vibrio pomeroyi]|uniref:ABC transporter permease n=1 Tax=Vibrio pomeroyi TaxID=198832 RepID=A0ABV4MR23_9VIBR|nr:ABC transporter permease [Vibrio atlanticus]MCZ4311399.1 ABC transporter permease [Vibrio atlanticus]